MSASIARPRGVFLVESLTPAASEDASSGVADRVSTVCADLRAAGRDVTFLGVLIVPEDELAFHVFAAARSDVVLEASRRAGLRVERVVPSVAICVAGARSTSRSAL